MRASDVELLGELLWRIIMLLLLRNDKLYEYEYCTKSLSLAQYQTMHNQPGARSNIHGENDEHFLLPCEIENISCANYYTYPCDKVVDSYQFVNHDTALSNYFTICYHNCASLNLVRAYNGIRYACAGRSGNRSVLATI